MLPHDSVQKRNRRLTSLALMALPPSSNYSGAFGIDMAVGTKPRGEKLGRLEGERDPDGALWVAILRDPRGFSKTLGMNDCGEAAGLVTHFDPDLDHFLCPPFQAVGVTLRDEARPLLTSYARKCLQRLHPLTRRILPTRWAPPCRIRDGLGKTRAYLVRPYGAPRSRAFHFRLCLLPSRRVATLLNGPPITKLRSERKGARDSVNEEHTLSGPKYRLVRRHEDTLG